MFDCAVLFVRYLEASQLTMQRVTRLIKRFKHNKSTEKVSFPGAIGGSVYTEKLQFLRDYPTIPTYRVPTCFLIKR